MAESAKKRIPGSNLAKMSPEKRAKVESFRSNLGQKLVDNLNRNVLLEESKMRKLTKEEQKALDELMDKLQEEK
jgi:hypothetical protein